MPPLHPEVARVTERIRERSRTLRRAYLARVDAARRLLEESETPLQRVASRCGFSTPDTMRRAFLRRIGCGPSEYRERFRR